MRSEYSKEVRTCNGQFSVGKHFESDHGFVYTEIMGKGEGRVNVLFKDPRMGHFRYHGSRREKYYKRIRRIDYLPIKGLMHDPMCDKNELNPWFSRIGPALSSTSIGTKNHKYLLHCF
jgi:hypothetical protein